VLKAEKLSRFRRAETRPEGQGEEVNPTPPTPQLPPPGFGDIAPALPARST